VAGCHTAGFRTVSHKIGIKIQQSKRNRWRSRDEQSNYGPKLQAAMARLHYPKSLPPLTPEHGEGDRV
jgi:hypothetical protein